MDTLRKRKSDPKFPYVMQESKRPPRCYGPSLGLPAVWTQGIELRLSRGLPDTLAPRDPWPRLVWRRRSA